MLTELRIADLGVISEVVLEPGPGFTAVTGETGAGKTMVVTSLGLLLGARAEPRLVRRGASRAVVEGRWRITAPDTDQVAELGGDVEADEVLVARHVSPTRSRSFVGGAGVPVGVASTLVGSWATIHGQSEQLATPERQREVLDRFAGPELASVLSAYQADFTARREAAAELATLITTAQQRAREADLLGFGLAEIAAVSPVAGEDVSLAAEAHRLQAIDDLRTAAATALASLAGADDDLDAPSSLGWLGVARKAMAGPADADPALAQLAQRVEEISFLLADTAADLSSYLADLEADPARLESIAERRAALQRLTRKYGPSLADVLAWAEDAESRSARLATSDERIGELQARVDSLSRMLAERASHLTARRTEAAARLAGLVHRELDALALGSARLEFQVTPLNELGPHGADQVQLLFSSHPSVELAPLARTASGGELSRVRLALEVVLADQSSGQTFVFDEVDAGVGGAVALEIGRRLALLAEHLQVIVVTHLAQVAAFADTHYVVRKDNASTISTSSVVEVRGPQRQAELARMMGGLASTDSALAHAAELLAEAGNRK